MTSKGRLFAKALVESPTMTNILSSVTVGSGTQIFSTIKVATSNDLPVSANVGDQAYVIDINSLLVWNGSSWSPATASAYSGTASSASWTGSGPYTQVISMTGLLSTDKTILELDLSQVAFADVVSKETAFGYVYRAVPADNQITLYATETPLVSFNINVVVL